VKQVTRNKNRGLDFEHIFQKKALREGYNILKNHLTAFWIPFPRRQLKVIKGELDFRMFDRKGRISYLDCKTFNTDHFVYSVLDEHQINRACLYNDWNIASGFIVYFMPLDKVVFFSGHAIKRKGARSSFRPEDGKLLGGLVGMRVSLIFGEPPSLAASTSASVPTPVQGT